MAEAAKRNATYADLEAVPDTMVAEIIDGDLVTQPRPAPRHGAASYSLGGELASPFQKGKGGPGGWIFIDEPELHFGIQVCVPDIAGWKKERLASMPDQAFIEIAPDWVCEVLSPATEVYDRGAKRRIYHEAGVRYMWLVNPEAKFLEVFEAAENGWTQLQTIVEGEQVSAVPFDAISFDIDVLWPLDFASEDNKS